MDLSGDPGDQYDMGTSWFWAISSDDPLPMNRIFLVILKRYGVLSLKCATTFEGDFHILHSA
jgi:hypothetical protein